MAVGDSITAGYADGALYREGQLNTYANILAQQLKGLGGGNFKQPLMPPGSVGVDSLGNSRLVLEKSPGSKRSFLLAYLSARGDIKALKENAYHSEGPYNNVGVPGAKAITLVYPGFGNPALGTGNYNPFFTRIASDPAAASVLSDALRMDPTFFSVFIGNNDALAFALSGGTCDAITPAEGAVGKGFKSSLYHIVEALMAKGARGILANLPSIGSIPYFTTIPYDGLELNAEQALVLNERYRGSQIRFEEGKNPFVICDTQLPGGCRPAQKGDLILLDLILDPHKDEYLLAREPIPEKYRLSALHAMYIDQAIGEYNTIIHALALEKNLAFVNIHQLVKNVRADRYYDPESRTIGYSKRCVFSLDGLHPNAFGQALMANEFIKAIQHHYGLHVPQVQSRDYKSISFPEFN